MMFLGFFKRCLHLATFTPLQITAKREAGLLSLVLLGVVLGEILLCGLIISRISCEKGCLLYLFSGHLVATAVVHHWA